MPNLTWFYFSMKYRGNYWKYRPYWKVWTTFSSKYSYYQHIYTKCCFQRQITEIRYVIFYKLYLYLINVVILCLFIKKWVGKSWIPTVDRLCIFEIARMLKTVKSIFFNKPCLFDSLINLKYTELIFNVKTFIYSNRGLIYDAVLKDVKIYTMFNIYDFKIFRCFMRINFYLNEVKNHPLTLHVH